MGFFLLFCGLSSSGYVALPCLSVIYASMRVEEKFLEVTGGGGGLFTFKVAEANRRKRSFIQLSFQEFRWVAVPLLFLKGRTIVVENF